MIILLLMIADVETNKLTLVTKAEIPTERVTDAWIAAQIQLLRTELRRLSFHERWVIDEESIVIKPNSTPATGLINFVCTATGRRPVGTKTRGMEIVEAIEAQTLQECPLPAVPDPDVIRPSPSVVYKAYRIETDNIKYNDEEQEWLCNLFSWHAYRDSWYGHPTIKRVLLSFDMRALVTWHVPNSNKAVW